MKLTFFEIFHKIFERGKFRFVFILTSLIFFFVYFFSLGYISYFPDFNNLTRMEIVDDWTGKIFRERVPFVWEPIATMYVLSFAFFVSIPNLILGILLSTLVGLNFSVSFFSYSLPKICRINPSKTLSITLPSLLTGFACCAPTFIIALGSATAGLTTLFISVRPIFMPISFLILTFSLIWSLNKIRNILQKYQLKL